MESKESKEQEQGRGFVTVEPGLRLLGKASLLLAGLEEEEASMGENGGREQIEKPCFDFQVVNCLICF